MNDQHLNIISTETDRLKWLIILMILGFLNQKHASSHVEVFNSSDHLDFVTSSGTSFNTNQKEKGFDCEASVLNKLLS